MLLVHFFCNFAFSISPPNAEDFRKFGNGNSIRVCRSCQPWQGFILFLDDETISFQNNHGRKATDFWFTTQILSMDALKRTCHALSQKCRTTNLPRRAFFVTTLGKPYSWKGSCEELLQIRTRTTISSTKPKKTATRTLLKASQRAKSTSLKESQRASPRPPPTTTTRATR